ncbi:TPR Domain containing protein [Rhodopirellula islandica]|uniref:TPR Domain containing protein n=1 Tax=Rhodopirellula islandica TaxID=595434 RepID=A0A0J1BMF0_RHOIS|nr:tetratricopeptide repeat protein [Rhodopirellula islandica]KLU07657.1 TPR Domain containing protein [Rhodopirellula islandica]
MPTIVRTPLFGLSCFPRVAGLLLVMTLVLNGPAHRLVAQDDSTQDSAAVALYADAANFQTNGAIGLAVDTWTQFLKKYPDSALASKASHYLGVCYMQQDTPDLKAAADAFQVALQDTDYDLREESLSNRGWCLYAAAGTGEEADPKLLRESIATYDTLIKENPDSRLLDRAYFYRGEAQYAMGELDGAIESYNAMMKLDGIADSVLRCDALYARGVALEEQKKYDQAQSSYQQLLKACADSDLVLDVEIRMGDMLLLQGEMQAAVKRFDSVANHANATPEDKAYSLFRQGYAFAQDGDPSQASASYEKLLTQFPKSPYAAAATLASAQTLYQAGDLSGAAARFRDVLQGTDPEAATESAHWLARIELGTANRDPTKLLKAAQSAYEVASEQIKRGPQGNFAVALKLDAAEALSLQPDRLKDALDQYRAIASDHAEHALAPRALYNAAFVALQLGETEQAAKLADDFDAKYPRDPLAPDASFVGAEALLASGQAEAAAKRYQSLVDSQPHRDHPQRPTWILRGATAWKAAGEPTKTAALIRENLGAMQTPEQKAEALLLAGQAELSSGDAAQAAKSFQASREAAPEWARSDEAFLMAGQSQLAAGNRDAAAGIWKELIRTNGESRMADQARYKLGQLANGQQQYAEAIEYFAPILTSQRDLGLLPFARYAKGMAELQSQQHAQAVKTLSELIKETPDHALMDDALLSRGIAYRHLDQDTESRNDLTAFLETQPTGNNLGHALYELALLDQNASQTAKAAESLQRIVEEVPDYPDMDKVLYELGWSLRESGQDEQALAQFEQLISKFPDNALVADAAYFVGQDHYRKEGWTEAAKAFQIAADKTADLDLKEKSLYRLGWSHYKQKKYAEAEAAFKRQYVEVQQGGLLLDAMMMIGESRFKQEQYDTALRAYSKAREKIVAENDSAKSIRDRAERQVRELILLHGGQSAAQLGQFEDAIDWYNELRERFPATTYLPQVFYEIGFAAQNAGNDEQALKFYSEVADNFRSEIAARARFMMGEIHFANKTFDKAIPEFQRVMFGFGADKADPVIKNWQAKSGFEAGRCAELLTQSAQTDAAKAKATKFAQDFYQYVIDQHPGHELAAKAKQRAEALKAP